MIRAPRSLLHDARGIDLVMKQREVSAMLRDIDKWAARVLCDPKSSEEPPKGWHSKKVVISNGGTADETVTVRAVSVTGELYSTGEHLSRAAEQARRKANKGGKKVTIEAFPGSSQKRGKTGRPVGVSSGYLRSNVPVTL
jgi:hypothetical protein